MAEKGARFGSYKATRSVHYRRVMKVGVFAKGENSTLQPVKRCVSGNFQTCLAPSCTPLPWARDWMELDSEAMHKVFPSQ